MGPYRCRVALASFSSPTQKSAGEVGVCTPCGAVSSREITVYSPCCRSYSCMKGSLNRRWGPIFPRCGGIVRFPLGATPAGRPSPPDWPSTGWGGRLGRWDSGSGNAGMNVICLLYYYYTEFCFSRFLAEVGSSPPEARQRISCLLYTSPSPRD